MKNISIVNLMVIFKVLKLTTEILNSPQLIYTLQLVYSQILNHSVFVKPKPTQQ